MLESDINDLRTGLDLLKKGRFDEARTLLLTVRERSPDSPDAHLLAALAARGLGRTTIALREIDRALEIAPALADLHANRGAVLCDLERYDESEAALLEALRLNPSDPDALGDLGRVLLHQKRPEEALTCLEPVAAVRPDDAGLLSDIGVSLMMVRRVEEAIRRYEAALRLVPEDAEIHTNYSRALLLAGRYLEGFTEGEWRFRTSQYAHRQPLSYPVWEGESLDGKTILLIAEQGFGDVMQMIRYAPLIAREGARVFVSCRSELKRLIAAMPSVSATFSADEATPPVHVCVPMLSLPRIFETKLSTIPNESPYLVVPPGLKKRDLPEGGLRVGLTWTGKTNRTLPFDALAPLFQVEGATFFSFQFGPQAHNARQQGLFDATEGVTDFAESAALLSEMDLVVASDTAVAHLACALGKPTLVLLQVGSDWRWGLSGSQCPWYPTATLYRQEPQADWTDPIAAVVRELERCVQESKVAA